MPALPLAIPAAARAGLEAALAAAGIELGALKSGTRVTHTVITQDGTEWELTYLGPMGDEAVWHLAGPGVEHGNSLSTTEAAERITAPPAEPDAAPASNNYIPTAAISAALKRRLTEVFPGVNFHVRKGRGTGSAGVSVSWTDGPSYAEVNRVAAAYQGSYWDGYNECYRQAHNILTVTYKGETMTGKPLVDHIGTQQYVSDATRAAAAAIWSEAHDGADPEKAGHSQGFVVDGEFVHDARANRQVDQIAREVVLPRRWAAAKEEAILAEAAKAEQQGAAPAPAEPSGGGLSLVHSEEEGVVVRGTSRGDGSASVLKAAGFRWYRKGGFWYLPGTRNAEGALCLAEAVATLRAGGLTVTAAGADTGPEEPTDGPTVPDVPEARAEEQSMAPLAPTVYYGVPVPGTVAKVWDGPLGEGWRYGVRSAQAAG
ncbi:hypothetical protein PH213_20455 [Streptomyces sp. SRF1]|uniref:LPD29 domain-containing protein n=1 Tax=Streptomyces sp. SRF1 TaxID=1549642 RepID=UPI0025AFBD78|nr:LPD29 domain-containing protein [Streptomyces sp. SRF1]MDN3056879.1 hypothetical protein [Streptomyces sp. SRF1]